MRRAVGVAPARQDSTDRAFEWQSPDGSVTVRIEPAILAEVAAEPDRGGILLGWVNPERGCTVEIERIEKVEGQFWRARTGEERLSFDLALARSRAGQGPRPMGYYRPCTEERLGPGGEELLLIARHFPLPYNVFLFFRPSGTAGISCWQHGQVLEFVPDEFDLTSPVTKPRRPVVVPEPQRGARWASGALPYVLATFGLIALIAAAGILILNRDARTASTPPSSVQNSPRLSLSLQRTGTDYRVTWDRNAAPVQSATRGVLMIADGLFKTQIDLDPEQLRTGSLLYTPASGDILIQLRVAGEGGESAESVRALSPGGFGTAPIEVRPLEPVRTVRAPAAPASAVRSATGAADGAAEGAPEVRTVLTPSREFQAPRQHRPEELAPPELSGAEALPVTAGPVTGLPPAPEPPKEPAPAAETPKRISNFVPARAVRQQWPVMNQISRAALERSGETRGQVDVEVAIDAAGGVVSAQAIQSTGWSGKVMTRHAVDAARRWQFEPARLNGEAVPSRMVISFRIGEQAKR